MAGHVFISYERGDSGHIDKLCTILDKSGIPFWRDTANLWPGENWRLKIRAAIRDDAFAFLACFSRRSIGLDKSFQNDELLFAIEELRRRRPDDPWLIPVRLDDCQIPDLEIGGGRYLSHLQRVDLFGESYDANADPLVTAIRRLLSAGPRNAFAAGDGGEPGLSPSVNGHLRAVAAAIVTHLAPTSTGAPDRNLALAVELALCGAISDFAVGEGKASLAWPLLDADGFLDNSEIAAILARALTGNHLEDAPTLGRAWARSFLDGTRADELTVDAENLLGYLRAQALHLRPLAEAELRARLVSAHERVADLDRADAFDIGRSGRRLPPSLRFFLNDQTLLVARASRGFVGRKSVLGQVREFIDGDQDGYCFILANLGVGKTALLAHLAAARPDYARHFNVLSAGIRTPEQFLNNVCAQLIGAYRLDPELFPAFGNASTDLLLRLLEQSAAKARGKVVVLIDALDEAMTGSRLPGVNPLNLPRALPEGCRFIVTVRSGTEGWEPNLESGCPPRQLCVDVKSSENLEDARRYVVSRLANPGITGYLQAQGLAGEAFADEVAARSEGYFVYLRHVLDQYDAGGDLARRELEELPVGLMPFYEDQYERMRADTPQPQWDDVRLPVLIQLALAERPLTLYQLAAGARQREAVPVMSAIEQWRQFLVQTSGSWQGRAVPAYRLFHESFREFVKRKHEQAAEVADVERELREDWERRDQDRYGDDDDPFAL